jgi:hypothetical protein
MLLLFRRVPLARIALAHAFKLTSTSDKALQTASAYALLDASFISITHLAAPFQKASKPWLSAGCPRGSSN